VLNILSCEENLGALKKDTLFLQFHRRNPLSENSSVPEKGHLFSQFHIHPVKKSIMALKTVIIAINLNQAPVPCLLS
jgi:hypothetical protein